MSNSLSIAKVGALASTALLMGVYVWFQARNGNPSVAADTTTGQAVTKQVDNQPASLPGSKQAPAHILPGSKSDSVDITEILPGSKSAPIFPSEKPIVIPGSKSITPLIEVPDSSGKKRAPVVLPSSKLKVPIIPSPTGPPPPKAPPSSGQKEPAKPKSPVLPGSKSRAQVIEVDPETLKEFLESYRKAKKENTPASDAK